MKKMICVLLCVLLCFSATTVAWAAPEEEMVDRNIVMTAEKTSDGSIVVWLTDDAGSLVPSWIVYLEIDGVTVKTIDVDYQGAAKIEYDFPTERQSVTCLSYTGPYATVNYIGSRIDLTDLVYGAATGDTTAATEPTEATDDATAETTQPTQETAPTEDAATESTEATTETTAQNQGAMSMAPLTTAVNEEGKVAIGIDVDSAVLNATQLTAEDFMMNSRMWMDPSQYAQLVSTTDASLHLELKLHTEAGSKSNLIAAKNKDEAFSSYSDSEVTGFAVSTALVYVSDKLRTPLDVGDGKYVIEMPLPKCFDKSERLAVAVCTTDGLGPFQEVQKSDMLSVEIGRFQTIAVVGFGQSAAAGASWLDWLLWGGIALVIIGVLVLVLVTFRRDKKKDVAVEADTSEDESPRHVLIKPVAEETIETEPELSPEEIAQKVLMDFDEQTDLTNTEREQFRAKTQSGYTMFDTVHSEVVTAADQIGDDQRESIRREVEQLQETARPEVSVDDLLDELDDLLDQ